MTIREMKTGAGRKKKEVAADISVPVPKPRASRKKTFPVVAVISADGEIQGTLAPEKKKPLIAQLPFASKEVIFHDGPVSYDPRPPGQVEAFDGIMESYESAMADGTFAVVEGSTVPNGCLMGEDVATFTVDESEEVKASLPPPVATQEPLPVFTKGNLNLYMREHGLMEVPETTEIACFWCAHEFEGRPVFIPYDEKKGTWHVYGNFCSPECALAHCLDEKEDTHMRWEKVALLHRLYASVVGGRIYPAPSKLLLKLFGGSLSIEDYRSTIRKRSVRVDIHYPPMVSLLATMDTKPIDFYETTIHKTFVPLNTERVKKVEEGLRLKRSKPLKDRESTLDACMNLQIKRS
jgi:hypothetical protein